MTETTAGDGDSQLDRLPILPLRNSVLFPQVVIPLAVGRRRSIALVQEALSTETPIAIVTQKDPETDEPGQEDLYEIGTSAVILKVVKISDDNFSVIVQGQQRIRLRELAQTEPYLEADFEIIEEVDERDVEIDALFRNLKTTAKQVVRYIPEMPSEAGQMVEGVPNPGQLADFVAANLDVPTTDKQLILDSLDLKERLRLTLTFLTHQLEVLKVSDKIQSQVKEEIDKSQREYYLRQQLKAIKEQLGELDGEGGDLEDLAKAIDEKDLPEEVSEVSKKQLNRLRMMQPASSEYGVTRTYLETILDIPWNDHTTDHLDIRAAREILDEDHYDLDKVKKRIIEYLAVRKLKNDMKGPIICLVGPPGVGKTSLGKSVARALGRKFVRISLGGVHDEAEIRGHRRTYVGALPGRIVQGLRKAGTINPVFMLDEVDKVGRDFRGYPSAALLEVLDPEQNNSFSDHYLELALDLSKVLFITTANLLDPIHAALRDRMEVIEIPGYTFREKHHIARGFLIPRQIEAHGISEEHIEITDEALHEVVNRYTREAGVRNLERRLADMCRGVAVRVAEAIDAAAAEREPEPGNGHASGERPAVTDAVAGNGSGDTVASGLRVPESFEKVVIAKENLKDYLGAERFTYDVAERVAVPGVATGLAWTAAGGDILFIESSKMPGKGELMLTGQLGDVMKESARAALSFIRSRTGSYAIDPAFFREHDIHIHVPAGAIPKDGPSAGITLFASLLSLVTGRRVRDDIAMTGEITLRGSILPVGGIKEKVLAAHRAQINRVILPERCRKDMDDVSDEIKEEMDFVFVSKMAELPELVLDDPPTEGSAQDAEAA